MRALLRRLGRRSWKLVTRQVSDDALVHEVARRMKSPDHGRPGELIELVSERLPDELAGELAFFTPARPMEYEGAEILLRVSSRHARRRLRAIHDEPFTFEWLETSLEPGDVLYDIGANVGVYSLVAANVHPGQVRAFAFEPSVPTYNDLCSNIALNGLEDAVTPMPVALWSDTTSLPFAYRSLEPGDSKHEAGVDEPELDGHVQTMMAYRLDDLVEQFALPAPTHIKIDVDGPELRVLEGARSTLDRPEVRSLLVEVEGSNEEELCALLAEHGFETTRRFDLRSKAAVCYRLFERVAVAALSLAMATEIT